MASAVKFPLTLIIQALDKATAPLRKVSGELSKIDKMARGARKAGLALSAGLTAPLTAIGVKSFQSFSKFNEGMSNVATLVDTNVESVDEMGKTILEMGRRIPVPIDQLINGLTEARGAGVSASDQFAVLEGSAKLAMVGLGQTSEAVDIVTSAMNSFNLKGEEATKIYNTIFQATNVGKATISQLAQGFGSVAGVVATAGVSLEEYMASVAALTTTGLPASEAHRQLRAVIAGLTRDTKLSSAVFRHLGAKDFKDLIKQSGGLVPALERIKASVRGNDQQMLEMLGSVNAFNATLGLTGAQGDAFREALALMEDGGDTFEKKFEEKTKSIEAQKQKMANALESLSISIGRVLVPAFESLVPLVDKLANAWEGLSPATQKTAVVFGAVTAAVGPALMVFGSFVSLLTGGGKVLVVLAGWAKYLWVLRAAVMKALIPAFTAAISSVWAFTAALLANPITWIVLGIAALAGAVYLIYKNWEPIKEFFSDVWGGLVDITTSAWEGITAFFSGLWDGVVEIFTSAWEKIKPIADGAMKLFKYSPFGLALKAGGAIGKALFGGEERPSLGAERAASSVGMQRSEAHVTVDFQNMPRGTRVSQAPQSTTPMDLNRGYSMATP